LFQGSVGRTDLPGGSSEQLFLSIQSQLLVLDDGLKIYSGHGPMTTLGQEKQMNPYVHPLL